jgi:hypothetical protein
VIECAPTESDEVVKVAAPLEIVPDPSVVPPSLEVTEPDGDALVTVATRVTLAPNVEVTGDKDNVVVELAWLTVWVVDPELPALFVSPL